MTIAELLAEISTSQERIWAILQYWSSVSFGLIIAMHMIQTQLKWVLVSALLLIYSAFSAFCVYYVMQANALAFYLNQQAYILIDELQTQGNDFSLVRDGLEASWSSGFVGASSFFLAGVGLFFLTNAYAIYRQLVIREEAS